MDSWLTMIHVLAKVRWKDTFSIEQKMASEDLYVFWDRMCCDSRWSCRHEQNGVIVLCTLNLWWTDGKVKIVLVKLTAFWKLSRSFQPSDNRKGGLLISRNCLGSSFSGWKLISNASCPRIDKNLYSLNFWLRNRDVEYVVASADFGYEVKKTNIY